MNELLNSTLFEIFANALDTVYVYVCDMKKDISRWSKSAVEYFGLEEEFMENAGAKWLELVHPEDRTMYMTDLAAVFNGTAKDHQCKYRMKNKTGEYVMVECRGSVITDEKNIPSVFAGVVKVINE